MTLKATHTGKIKIGNMQFPVAVLENKQRVISQKSIGALLGITGFLESYLNLDNIKPFVSDETMNKIKNPLTYTMKSGESIQGYDSSLLNEICYIWFNAQVNGAIKDDYQKVIATKATDILSCFATVGLEVLAQDDLRSTKWGDRFNELHNGDKH